MIDETTYHQINSYLDGSLQGSALDKFKINLKTDKELQLAVTSQSAIIKAIEDVRDQELKTILKNSGSQKTAIFSISPAIKMALSTAAAIALLVAAYFTFSPFLLNNNSTADTDKSAPVLETEQSTVSMNEDKALETEIAMSDSESIATNTTDIPPPPSEFIVKDYTEDDIEEEDTETDKYEEKDQEEILKEVATATNAEKTPVPASTGDKIATDLLVSSRSFSVKSIGPDYTNRDDSEDLDAVQASEKKSLFKLKNRKAEAKKTDTESDDAKSENYKTQSINVEYWKSVVNFEGYRYGGAKVQLYGIGTEQSISFTTLDNRLYLRMNNKQYYIQKNNTHNRLTAVTNATLLKVLND